jgi:cytochrome b561
MWLLLTMGSAGAGAWPFNWRVTIGAGLMLVAVITFAGFYLASPATTPTRDPWMRNAIAATFVAFYLVLLTLLLVAPNFRIEVSTREPVPSRFDPRPVAQDASVAGDNADARPGVEPCKR